MQWAENDPDAFFRFSLGKTSLFAVSASESRSVRFSGAYNYGFMLNAGLPLNFDIERLRAKKHQVIEVNQNGLLFCFSTFLVDCFPFRLCNLSRIILVWGTK
ncbi:TPA: hypothetical protein L6K68_005090 [Escherichia coli]|nr:hypothetical protein [Escherichia coli]